MIQSTYLAYFSFSLSLIRDSEELCFNLQDSVLYKGHHIFPRLIQRRSKNNPSVLILGGLEIITLSTPDDFTLRHKNGTLIIDGGRQLRLAIINITATNITDQDSRFTWIPFTFEGSTNEHLILAAGGDHAHWQPLLDDPDTYPINRIHLAYEKAANDAKRAHYVEFASDNDSDVEEQRMAARDLRILKQQHDDDYINAAATIALEKVSENITAPPPTAIISTDTPSSSSKEAPPEGETTPPNGNSLSNVKNKSDSSKADNQDHNHSRRGRGKRNQNRNHRSYDDENLDTTTNNNFDNNSSSSSSIRGGGRRGRGGRRQYRSRSRSPQRYNQRRRYQDYDRGYQERERSPYYQRRNRDRDDYGPRRSDSSRDYHRDNESARFRNDRDRNDDTGHSRTNRDAREKNPTRNNESISLPSGAGTESNIATASAAPTAPTVGFQAHGTLNSFMPNGPGIPALPFMATAPPNNWSNTQPFQQFGTQQNQHSLQHQHLHGQWPANTVLNNLPFPPPPGVWNGGLAPSMPPPQWSNNMMPYNSQPPPFNTNTVLQPQQPQQQQQHQQLQQQHYQHYPGAVPRAQGSVLGDDPEIQFITNTGTKKRLRNSLFRYESRR